MDHPLTDEEITNFAQPEIGYFDLTGLDGASEVSLGYDSDDLRAAADWQLEQVIEWLEETEYDQYHHNKIIYANDLRKVMRPQQQEGK